MIYIVGNSRSGTKLMEDVLDRSEDVYTFNELHFFEYLFAPGVEAGDYDFDDGIELFAKLYSIQENSYLNPDKFKDSLLDIYRPVARMVLQTSSELSPFITYKSFCTYYSKEVKGKGQACDPTPRNQFFIDQILENDPRAKVIYCFRDPRAVLYSMKRKWTGAWRNNRLGEAIRQIINYNPIIHSLLWRRSMDNYVRHENQVIACRYEDLVHLPEQTVEQISNLIGIHYTSSMLNINRTNSSHGDSNLTDQGIYKSSVDLWKSGLSRTEKFICGLITKPYLSGLGYAKETIRPAYIGTALIMLISPVQLLFIFLFNFSKYKNIFSAISKRFF